MKSTFSAAMVVWGTRNAFADRSDRLARSSFLPWIHYHLTSCARAVICRRLRLWNHDLVFSHLTCCVHGPQRIAIEPNSTARHDIYQKKMLFTLPFDALNRLADTVMSSSWFVGLQPSPERNLHPREISYVGRSDWRLPNSEQQRLVVSYSRGSRGDHRTFWQSIAKLWQFVVLDWYL
jgi:hypothetical protein